MDIQLIAGIVLLVIGTQLILMLLLGVLDKLGALLGGSSQTSRRSTRTGCSVLAALCLMVGIYTIYSGSSGASPNRNSTASSNAAQMAGADAPTGEAQPKTLTYAGRVIDLITGQPIRGASVNMDLPEGSSATFSDSEGIFTVPFELTEASGQVRGWLRIDAIGYRRFEQILTLSKDTGPEDIRLQPLTIAWTDTPTPTPTDTHTPSATSTPTRAPTNITTNTPVAEATQALASSSSLRLIRPEIGGCYNVRRITFEWQWDRSLRNDGEYGGEFFALAVWPEGGTEASIVWIKESNYTLETVSGIIDFIGGARHFWTVTVVEQTGVPRDDNWRLIAKSATGTFIYGCASESAPGPQQNQTPTIAPP